jgi:hypothetical protein
MPGMTTPRPYTIRLAGPADESALRTLAELDSAAPLTGSALIAEYDDGIAAAVAMDDDRAIADPFRPTAGLLIALRTTRANHVRAGIAPRRRDRAFATLLRPVAALY